MASSMKKEVTKTAVTPSPRKSLRSKPSPLIAPSQNPKEDVPPSEVADTREEVVVSVVAPLTSVGKLKRKGTPPADPFSKKVKKSNPPKEVTSIAGKKEEPKAAPSPSDPFARKAKKVTRSPLPKG